MRFRLLASGLLLGVLAGCGTTRWTDTKRSATEQLLISDAMDRAVSRLDLRALAGKEVFLDTAPLKQVTDQAYLSSSLRQHLLASGCLLRDKREEAEYIVEARAGTIGTDHHDVLFGVPATNIPSYVPLHSVPASIPELPLVKKTEQRAVAKIALFAYNRTTGRPLWQSGITRVESKAKDIWVLGAGPFQRGSIYDGTKFAGGKLTIPLLYPGRKTDGKVGAVSVADEAHFVEPKGELAREEKLLSKKASGAAGGTDAATGRRTAFQGVVPAGQTAPADGAMPEISPSRAPAAATPTGHPLGQTLPSSGGVSPEGIDIGVPTAATPTQLDRRRMAEHLRYFQRR